MSHSATYSPNHICYCYMSYLFLYTGSIVARWRNYFSQLFNVHGVKDAGQVEINAVGTGSKPKQCR